jgi:excisionase family DNA binding protein
MMTKLMCSVIPMINLTQAPDILTLEEAAAYLRVSPETIVQQVQQGNLPGRKIEDGWRFLRTAIDDWLRVKDSRQVMLQQIGAFADDHSLSELTDAIYQARGRSEFDAPASTQKTECST